jgi:hypothetical protein
VFAGPNRGAFRCDEVLVLRRGRLQTDRLAIEQSRIAQGKLDEHSGVAPSVEDRVVEAQGGIECVQPGFVRSELQERRRQIVEASPLLLLQTS